MLKARLFKPSLDACRRPALIQRQAEVFEIQTTSHEQQDVIVGMPPVVHRPLAAVGDFQRPDTADAAHLPIELLGTLATV